ncbi:MAG: CHRD domain-containing protein [Gemmatimonadaceae bacterium]
MRSARLVPALAALAFVAGCTEAPTAARTFTIPVFASSTGVGNFDASMASHNEVPPNKSGASGTAVLTLNQDETTLHYQVTVLKAEKVTQSHIHIAPAGSNGPVVVFLYGFNAAGVTIKGGILAEGDITAANLIPNAGIGFGGTMAEFIAALRTSNAYVNVHTIERPAGEIRGQVTPN